jgi:glycosyltransferase involved in cell wall biosynthesis
VVRVTCAVPYAFDTVPAQRFRWEQWAKLLHAEGVDVGFVAFGTVALADARARSQNLRAVLLAARRLPGWAVELSAARRADLLVVMRNAALTGPPLAELALHRLGVPLVYDIDDAVYLPPPTGDNAVRRLLRSDWRVGVLCARAALVAAGNPTLAEYARRFTEHVEIWPTTIHMAVYGARPEPRPDAVPVVGWSGSASTVHYLRPLLPLLRDLQRRIPFRLLVVGARIELEGLEGECRPWTAATEVASLHEMDVGLMPLDDTPWSRGKCALKALQYLAVGMPAVVADVGVNAAAVPDGRAGFVVRTDEEWADRLTALLRDPALRRRLGAAGRAHVAQHYSGEAWAPRIGARLHALAAARGRGRARDGERASNGGGDNRPDGDRDSVAQSSA